MLYELDRDADKLVFDKHGSGAVWEGNFLQPNMPSIDIFPSVLGAQPLAQPCVHSARPSAWSPRALRSRLRLCSPLRQCSLLP
jgi:hypothetical protein